MEDRYKREERPSWRSAAQLGGCSALGLLATGAAGLLMAFGTVNHLDPIAGALALVASALAFGFIMNAVYRR